MPRIHLTNFIAAPVQRVFDLSRSVELHASSMKLHQEKAINGTMSGLMKLNDTVTWSAKHLRKTRTLKVRITEFNPPFFFSDEQEAGDFVSMRHEHHFKPVENGTVMIDVFCFETACGILGKAFNKLYLEKYMTGLLQARNQTIKKAAETAVWKQYLN